MKQLDLPCMSEGELIQATTNPKIVVEFTEAEAACLAMILGMMKRPEMEAKIAEFKSELAGDVADMIDALGRRDPFAIASEFFDMVADHFVD